MAAVAPALTNPGFGAVWRRECARMFADQRSRLLLLILPLAGWLLVLWLFWPRVAHHLPIAVYDADRSALSRQLLRNLAATPAVRLAWTVENPEEGRDLVLRGDAYALIAIPAGLQREALRGKPSPVQLYYNAQFLTASNLVARDVRTVTATTSVVRAAGRRALQGEARPFAIAAANPVGTQLHPLFNPALDYARFLALAVIAAMLHIFAVVAAADACGRELRERSAGSWSNAAGGKALPAVAGKLAPHALWFGALSSSILLVTLAVLGIEIHGHMILLVLGLCLFMAASLALGAFLVGLVANLRMATSLASLIISPALAFSGLTFPTMSMPVAIKLWSLLLPLTYYIKLQVEQVSMGAPLSTAPALLLPLLLFTVLPFLLLPRWRRILPDEAYWGRQ